MALLAGSTVFERAFVWCFPIEIGKNTAEPASSGTEL
jgi:hypothetical protein